MKARRRWLLAAIALALLLAGALAVPFLVDEPPPDDADLLAVRVEVPWEENGYHAFDVAVEDVYLPDGRVSETVEGEETEEGPGASEIARGEGWDPDLARDVLERNAGVLRKLEECLARPKLRFPVEEGDDGERWIDHRPWIRATDVLLIRARSHLREGKHEDAARDVERTMRLGRRIQQARGFLVDLMMGRAIESLGLGALRDLAGSPGVDPILLAPLAREVGSASSTEAGREALKADYAVFSSYIDQVLMEPDDPRDRGPPDYLWDLPPIWRDPLFLKPNASRRLYAGKLRILSRNLGLPILERTDLRIEALEAGPIRRWIPRPNALGRSIIAYCLRVHERGVADTADLDLSRAFTATGIALKCREARHHTLPPALDALVPEYLDAVPRDPYDGKPLRYSAEKRIVYSVGNDGKDSGGLADPDTDDACLYRAEPTFRIELGAGGG